MVKIRDSKGRSDENSGYTRLLGNPELGHLVSQVQASVIRSGNELEKILASLTNRPIIVWRNVSSLVLIDRSGIDVVFDPQLSFPDSPAIRADILVLDHTQKHCYVIELKDGDTFDTKKASGELASLKRFALEITKILGYSSTYHFCSFNQPDKVAIVRGAKGRFTTEEVMTGRELCELLNINFENIIEYRILEQQENLTYLIDQLWAISEVREGFLARLANSDISDINV